MVCAGLALGLSLAFYVAWPVPIAPEAWTPPVALDPAEQWPKAQWQPDVTVLSLGAGRGPEDVEVDAEGRVYGGLANGDIVRMAPDGSQQEVLVNTGGRPLGLHWDAQGALIVADSEQGVLRYPIGGRVETVTTTCGGKPMVFTDDLDVAGDGSIWFSDASARFTRPDWKLDLLENRPNGRLCRWDPSTGETVEVVTGLYFANGVAIDPDQQYVLVTETSRYRVRRVWIDGPRSGESEVVIDNLPGFPDGISTGSMGRYWIALASPRSGIVDRLGPFPWARGRLLKLPESLQPGPRQTLQVLGIEGDGTVVHHAVSLANPAYALVTSVQERGSRLWLGSLRTPAIGTIQTPEFAR